MFSHINPEVLAAGVHSRLWQNISVVASTGSTNADLIQAAKAGSPSGMVLVADHQDQGRGRLDRRWIAPPGSMAAMSVLLRPEPVASERWSWLPLLAGLAVADGLHNAVGAKASLKWPNDVLLGERKICGILAERVAEPTPAVVIGMGINTQMTSAQLPVPSATSLAIAGYPSDPHPVVAGVLDALADWYSRWEAGENLTEPYLNRCATIGKKVNVLLSEIETFTGEAIGIDPDGQLLVRGTSEVRTFSAGDVVHLR